MIERFLDYLSAEKRYSANTIASYGRDLQDFANFFIETEGAEDISKADKKIIRNFINHLSTEGFSKRSINRKLSALRGYFLFLMKVGQILATPMEAISSLKFYPEKQVPLSEEEMEALKNNYEEEDGLEALVLETLYQTGMRKAELCNLLVENVGVSSGELKVIGKGNKARIIPISQPLAQALEAYLRLREPAPGHEPYFFLTKKGKKLNEKFVYTTVNSYLSLVTTKQKKSPHMLRHSFATHVLNHGAEISKVKSLLGHASLASTQVYTSANIAQLKKVFGAAHPRAIQEEDQQ